MRRWQIEWLSVAALSRSLGTIGKGEGLSNLQIADRLGRAPATIKAYFYDPTGEKARAVKARYQGVCRGCGAYTQPRNGKGDAYAYCKACHPGAIERRWTRERVLDAMREWRAVLQPDPQGTRLGPRRVPGVALSHDRRCGSSRGLASRCASTASR